MGETYSLHKLQLAVHLGAVVLLRKAYSPQNASRIPAMIQGSSFGASPVDLSTLTIDPSWKINLKYCMQYKS